ncbi:hypothetical protein CEXT_399171 [Caerostris extrusa]|uniref:C-type lectin domain-containing protein n=1 Tax=Caerostris extrusa TaxID=172846 RepID=A0AAV4TQQ8_CAEEX|nr:hypothetical protein CEXT_399171 [Caerostris extrusa]
MYCPSSLWIFVLLKVIESCPHDYFEASEDTFAFTWPSQHHRSPRKSTATKKGGELFGRPMTPDMEDTLANEIARAASMWIPNGAYVGMERTSRLDFWKRYYDDTWVFFDETYNPFPESQYEVWATFANSGEDCAVVGLDDNLYVSPVNCMNTFALLCEKDELPCESPNLYYSNYDGRCLAVLKDYKSYENGLTSCPGRTPYESEERI